MCTVSHLKYSALMIFLSHAFPATGRLHFWFFVSLSAVVPSQHIMSLNLRSWYVGMCSILISVILLFTPLLCPHSLFPCIGRSANTVSRSILSAKIFPSSVAIPHAA